jgi:hypothetical protein
VRSRFRSRCHATKISRASPVPTDLEQHQHSQSCYGSPKYSRRLCRRRCRQPSRKAAECLPDRCSTASIMVFQVIQGKAHRKYHMQRTSSSRGEEGALVLASMITCAQPLTSSPVSTNLRNSLNILHCQCTPRHHAFPHPAFLPQALQTLRNRC